jgi:hypothetical protein
MSEWWTYRPSDFLMFSARSWGRLLEALNRDLWPLQPALVVAGLVLVGAAARDPIRAMPWITGLLAVAWAWVGWAFHWERFAAINTGAPWFAVAFVAEAVLLLALGTRVRDRSAAPWVRALGLVVAAMALVAYPLVAPLTGRGWVQAEVAGAAPDPTALLTIGLLLALPLRFRGWLLVVPVLALAQGWLMDWLLFAGR